MGVKKTTKTCNACKVPKDLTCFNKSRDCLECESKKEIIKFVDGRQALFRQCFRCNEEKPLTNEFFEFLKKSKSFRIMCRKCRGICGENSRTPEQKAERRLKNNERGKKPENLKRKSELRTERKKDPKVREKLRQQSRDLFQEDPEKFRLYHREYSRKLKARFTTSKRIAKRRELEWTLSFEEYQSIVSNDCFYCAYELGTPVKSSVGLDRIDNSKGYFKDNVLSCCGTCNKLRGDWLTVEETKVAVQAILAFREQQAQLASEQHLNPADTDQ